MQNSKIEWTDATWNPVTGCTKIGSGCDNCYAERIAERFRGQAAFPKGFELQLRPERLNEPGKWRKPRMVFVNSMSDLFHRDINVHYLDRVFRIMETHDQHIYQVLTKRSSRMRDYVAMRYGVGHWGPPHIWLGVSVEDGSKLSRVEHLRQTTVCPERGVRFVSFEPLIGGVHGPNLDGISWAIAGGESGPKRVARPFCTHWLVDLWRECQRQDVRWFFKQWGAHGRPTSSGVDGLTLEMLESRSFPI